MKRALTAIGGGYKDVVAATPVISALDRMGYAVDALVESPAYGAETLLSGWEALDSIYLTRRSVRSREKQRGYQAVVRTVESRGGALGVGPEFRPAPRTRERERPTERNLSALTGLGWMGGRAACHVEFDDPFGPLPERFVAVAPGWSRRDPDASRRSWPHWEAFCALCHERTGAEVVVLGREEDEADWMNDPERPWLLDLRGMTSIRGAAGVIARCETLYAIDNALGWIGAALGRPVVSLFGPTDDAVRAPVGETVRVVSSTLSCRPCRLSARRSACREARCMESLCPEHVLNAGMMEGARVAG
jgi:hypothetical protein